MLKIYIFFILFLLSALATTAQLAPAPQTQWTQCYGGTNDDIANCIIEAHNDGYIVAGLTFSTNGNVTTQNTHTGWIFKLNKQGYIEWQKRYGTDSSGYTRITSIAKCSNGGYVFAAIIDNASGDITMHRGKADYWVVKINDTGKIVWEKTFGGSENEFALAIIVDRTGNIVVGGTSFSNNGDVKTHHGMAMTWDNWLIKLDSNGNLIWENSYGGSADEYFLKLRYTQDNGYIICGNTSSNDGDVNGVHYGASAVDVWVAKIDSNGVLQWQRACGGGWADGSRDIAITPDGGCIFIASTVSSDGDVVGYHETPDSLKVRPDDRYTDIWIVKLSNKGKLEWQKCLGGALNDDPTAVVCDKYGNYIISGASFSKDGELPIDNLGRKTYLFKLDKQGNFIWKKHIGGTIGNGFNELLIDEDNCIVGAGATNSNDFDAITNHGDAYTIDAWVVKFCTELPPINIVANSNTLNIYPNPASSAVYIATQNVKEIRLIDALGRVYINKKIDNTNNAGFTYLSLNYIANGTYMVQAMDSNGQVKIGKLVVTK